MLFAFADFFFIIIIEKFFQENHQRVKTIIYIFTVCKDFGYLEDISNAAEKIMTSENVKFKKKILKIESTNTCSRCDNVIFKLPHPLPLPDVCGVFFCVWFLFCNAVLTVFFPVHG